MQLCFHQVRHSWASTLSRMKAAPWLLNLCFSGLLIGKHGACTETHYMNTDCRTTNHITSRYSIHVYIYEQSPGSQNPPTGSEEWYPRLCPRFNNIGRCCALSANHTIQLVKWLVWPLADKVAHYTIHTCKVGTFRVSFIFSTRRPCTITNPGSLDLLFY